MAKSIDYRTYANFEDVMCSDCINKGSGCNPLSCPKVTKKCKQICDLQGVDVRIGNFVFKPAGRMYPIHKQHTDPDQSERLIKAGLDSDTADMHYRDGAYHQGKPDMNTMAVVAPIWSAYALRKLMPAYISKDLNGNDISYRLGWEPTQRGFVVFYVDAMWHTFTLVEFKCEDLNDGYIDMMCWLLDKRYVEKEGGES